MLFRPWRRGGRQAGLGYFGAELVYGTPVPTTRIVGSVPKRGTAVWARLFPGPLVELEGMQDIVILGAGNCEDQLQIRFSRK
jgi:hypothetical protein